MADESTPRRQSKVTQGRNSYTQIARLKERIDFLESGLQTQSQRYRDKISVAQELLKTARGDHLRLTGEQIDCDQHLRELMPVTPVFEAPPEKPPTLESTEGVPVS